MKAAKAVISIAAIALFGAAVAQEETRMKIKVFSDESGHEAVRLDLDSDDLGFDLHEMQEGESQAIVDDEGRTILVTRTADGHEFDVDGKKISLPLLDGDPEQFLMLHGEHDENVDVQVVHDVIEIDSEHDGEHEVKVVKKVKIVAE